ncbi:alpha-copaene synthase-like isoform X1 [Hevea brasiliensis]|uniref:alpha-copaene synthase-like isoform X1 n=1 Tax=Hevea brasiliensis TaxID=3981 RepID=UPI0025F54E0E|nr:alpha-copaene synthase-like isoform X1 [Hevea brasiliensis]
MADQDSAFFTSTTNRINSANYHPAIWGDYFLTPVSVSKTTDTSIQQPFEVLKQEVRRMLRDDIDESSQKLHLINRIQRLGVAYHFTSEIEDALEKICHDYSSDGNDLYTAALWFRPLRQQGTKVSSDIFVKFKDSEGEFKESLKQDVDGMLSLYEAAHLGIRGEDILDEAIAFTTANLYSLLPQLSPHLAQQVSHALNRPIHKCLPRLEARHYIDAYKWDKSYNTTLLEFAKLDFNRLQEVHQKELNGITKWWKNLDFPAKLPCARDRLVECFFWSVGVYFEPQYSIVRKNLAKVISMATILDDTYDNYATCEELELLTDAIERWDIKTIDTLPEYMKMIYAFMLDLYNEIEESIAEEGSSYCVHYAKEAIKRMLRSYLAEAKWRNEGYVPTVEEYLQVSLISSGYPMVTTTSFLSMGKVATTDAFEWVSNDPKIIRALSLLCRLNSWDTMSFMSLHKSDKALIILGSLDTHSKASVVATFPMLRKDVVVTIG